MILRTKAFGSLALAVMVGIVACATAGGEVTGGELSEAGAQAAVSPELPDTGTANAVVALLCTNNETWAGLYRDLFGPTGRGSCTFTGDCHGPGGAGARSGTGPECFDEAGCCRSIVTKDLAVPERPESGLVAVIRRPRPTGTGTRGTMPKQPADFVFTLEEVERIRSWVASGADAGAGAPDAGDAGDAGDAAHAADAGDAGTGDGGN